MSFDMDALAGRVRAQREAVGLGLNVRFLNLDGQLDEYSFGTADRADAFRASLARAGRTIVDRAWLAAAYVERIGYDPFEDDPAITEGEVARILIEHREVAA